MKRLLTNQLTKRLFLVSAVLVLVVMFSGCSLHYPYGWDWETQREYRVIFKVDPDDAQVLLDGKWIGAAYEFSTTASALRLASRRHEIVIKKEGYVEEFVDLNEYTAHRVTLRMTLRRDLDYQAQRQEAPRPPAMPAKPPIATKPKKTDSPPKPAEPAPPMPPDTDATPVKVVTVHLEVLPEESAIYLDGKFWGLSPRDGKIHNFRLKPGNYNLEVFKAGYAPHKTIIAVPTPGKGDGDAQPLRVSVKLEKQ